MHAVERKKHNSFPVFGTLFLQIHDIYLEIWVFLVVNKNVFVNMYFSTTKSTVIDLLYLRKEKHLNKEESFLRGNEFFLFSHNYPPYKSHKYT